MTDTILNTGTTVEATVANNAQVQPTPVVVENATTEVMSAKTLRDMLADEFKEVKSLQNFKDINDLAKSYLNLNGLLGKKVNDWSKEDVDGFLVKAGRPVKAEDYVLPEELGRTSGDFKNIAFKAGLSQEQTKALADEFILSQRVATEASKKEAEDLRIKAEVELKREFGDAFETRLKIANKAINEVGGEELLNIINESGLGSNPVVVKAFAKMGVEFLQADKVVRSDRVDSFGVTPGEAQRIIDGKMADKEFRTSYYTRSHPNHTKAVEEMSVLFQRLGKK